MNAPRSIALIACCSTKLAVAAPARDLYQSALFKFSLKWCEQRGFNAIHVISAKHGLVDLDRTIEPYDQILNTMSAPARAIWGEVVLQQLVDRGYRLRLPLGSIDLMDEVTFLAGDRYRAPLVSAIDRVRVPMQGLGIGRQLQFLGRETAARF